MRVLLSPQSKMQLRKDLQEFYGVKTLQELSVKLGIPYGNIEQWFYNKRRYVPFERIPKELHSSLIIIDRQEDNWGRVKGGKKTISILLQKYGKTVLRQRQLNGARKSQELREQRTGAFSVDV